MPSAHNSISAALCHFWYREVIHVAQHQGGALAFGETGQLRRHQRELAFARVGCYQPHALLLSGSGAEMVEVAVADGCDHVADVQLAAAVGSELAQHGHVGFLHQVLRGRAVAATEPARIAIGLREGCIVEVQKRVLLPRRSRCRSHDLFNATE